MQLAPNCVALGGASLKELKQKKKDGTGGIQTYGSAAVPFYLGFARGPQAPYIFFIKYKKLLQRGRGTRPRRKYKRGRKWVPSPPKGWGGGGKGGRGPPFSQAWPRSTDWAAFRFPLYFYQFLAAAV